VKRVRQSKKLIEGIKEIYFAAGSGTAPLRLRDQEIAEQMKE
jgi:hypothetical protein